MLDLLDWTIIMLGVFAGPIIVICRAEANHWPVFSTIENSDVTFPNLIRWVTLTCSMIVLSYSLFVVGHEIGWGGLETILVSQTNILVISLGVIGIGTFIASRALDSGVYQMVGRHYGLQQLTRSEMKKEIREKSLIKKISSRDIRKLNEDFKLTELELFRETEEVHKMTKELNDLTKESKSRKKTLANVKSEKGRISESIKSTKEQIKTWDIEINSLSLDVDSLKQKLIDFQPLMEKKIQQLQSLKDDYGNLSSEEKKVLKNLKNVEKQNSIYDRNIIKMQKQIYRLRANLSKELEKKSKFSVDADITLKKLNSVEGEIIELIDMIENRVQVLSEFENKVTEDDKDVNNSMSKTNRSKKNNNKLGTRRV